MKRSNTYPFTSSSLYMLEYVRIWICVVRISVRNRGVMCSAIYSVFVRICVNYEYHPSFYSYLFRAERCYVNMGLVNGTLFYTDCRIYIIFNFWKTVDKTRDF